MYKWEKEPEKSKEITCFVVYLFRVVFTCGRFRRGHLKLHETHLGRCVIKSFKQTCLSLHLMLLQLAVSADETKKTYF